MLRISKSTLTFLTDLKNHNDRTWFNDNRPSRYEEARGNYVAFDAGHHWTR